MNNSFSQTSRFVFIIKVSFLTGLMLFFPQSNIWAVNAEEKVLVSADHMTLYFESGNSIYTGDVKASLGKLVLTGDKIVIQRNNNAIKRIVVIGKPARYHHVMDDGETITAKSEQHNKPCKFIIFIPHPCANNSFVTSISITTFP